MNFHLYADDTQLYLTFDNSRPDETSSALSHMEHCIADIEEWMLQNKSKLNDLMREFLQFQPHHQNSNEKISLGEDIIETSNNAKNLGVLLESDLSFTDHITSIVKAVNFKLFHLSRILKLSDASCTLHRHPLTGVLSLGLL